MSNGETPGIGGVTGIAQSTTKASTAWTRFVVGMTRTAPKQLRRAADARLGILRVKR